MNNQPMECPLCSKTFLSSNIEKHVQSCLDKDILNIRNSKENLKRKLDSKQLTLEPKQASPWKKVQPKIGDNSGKNSSCIIMSSKPIKNNLDKSLETISTKQSLFFKKPLPELARPSSLKEYVGQTDVIGSHTALFKLLQKNIIPSMILWGPPGCGKTTLAHIIENNVKNHNISSESKIHFIKLSATDSGKAELQATIKAAINKQHMFHSRTILFIDEIHRYNKLQQDSLLSAVENGIIILLGATTENPSFVLNSALLSRCQVFVLEKLETSHVKSLLLQALKTHLPEIKVVKSDTNSELVHENDDNIFLLEESLDILASLCNGDARTALNGLQIAIQTIHSTDGKNIVDKKLVKKCLQHTSVLYDRAGRIYY